MCYVLLFTDCFVFSFWKSSCFLLVFVVKLFLQIFYLLYCNLIIFWWYRFKSSETHKISSSFKAHPTNHSWLTFWNLNNPQQTFSGNIAWHRRKSIAIVNWKRIYNLILHRTKINGFTYHKKPYWWRSSWWLW